MKICVIGAGYVGLVTGMCLASTGNTITFIEKEKEKVDLINRGQPPLHEEGLETLMKRNRNRVNATMSYTPVADADIIFICVGTPSLENGDIDLTFIEDSAENIGKKLGDTWTVVAVKSTVVPGTTETIVLPLLEKHSKKTAGKQFGVAMNPEFLREGKAIEDFMRPDRIIVGAKEEKSADVLTRMYEHFKAPIVVTALATAEMIKYASNAFLATKISFSNEIGNLCKIMGIDTYEVMKGVGMDHRISPNFFRAGAGFGGSCFPKDVRALIAAGEKRGYNMEILHSVVAVNERQPLRMILLLKKHIKQIKEKKIAVLGLAFKEGTDDIRDSRSIVVIKELLKREAHVSVYDPLAMANMKKLFDTIEYCSTAEEALRGAEGCLIMTEWKEFSILDYTIMKKPVVIDGRRIIQKKQGIMYEGLCW
jgi:UDPglucose 6-dehydrogenase